MITRRDFFSKTLALGVIAPHLSMDEWMTADRKMQKFRYLSVIPEDTPNSKLPVPKGHRVAFGYDYFSLDTSEEGLVLNCPDIGSDVNDEVYLRLQVAIDTREEDEIDVYLNKTDRKIGHLSIWYPTGLQIFETKLDAAPNVIQQEGLRLRLTNGVKPAYFLASSPENGSHILTNNPQLAQKEETWMETLYSYRSVQPFGWLDGCGLDGLQELYIRKKDKKALKAIQKHLDLYLVDRENFIYVDLWARPRDNTFMNLEAGLPFAVIAQHRPDHPAVGLFLDFCQDRFDSSGNFTPDYLSTEGCYTLAYPLAVLARELNRPELYELALREVEERIAWLTDDEAVYNTGKKSEGKTIIRKNWGRGYVWFLLGLVKTAEILQGEKAYRNSPRVARLKEAFQYYAQIALSHQLANGGWNAYLDLPETTFESSATAGLAAAFAHAHRFGWLPSFSRNELTKVYETLMKYLTPDGFLTHVTQHNAGDINLLQKGPYRVIAQYALGFMAQIKAHL